MIETQRLFDISSKTCKFEARVLECTEREDGAYDVILDRTAFFPNEGGQACDTGALNGMPVLSVEDAPAIVFCNFDTKPGYAGVPNPLYEADHVLLMLGDAKESVAQLQSFLK